MYTVKSIKRAMTNGIFVVKPMKKAKHVDLETIYSEYVGMDSDSGVISAIVGLAHDLIKTKIKLDNGDVVKISEIKDQNLSGNEIESLLLTVSNGQIFKIFNIYSPAKDKEFYQVRERIIVAKTTFFEKI